MSFHYCTSRTLPLDRIHTACQRESQQFAAMSVLNSTFALLLLASFLSYSAWASQRSLCKASIQDRPHHVSGVGSHQRDDIGRLCGLGGLIDDDHLVSARLQPLIIPCASTCGTHHLHRVGQSCSATQDLQKAGTSERIACGLFRLARACSRHITVGASHHGTQGSQSMTDLQNTAAPGSA